MKCGDRAVDHLKFFAKGWKGYLPAPQSKIKVSTWSAPQRKVKYLVSTCYPKEGKGIYLFPNGR